MKRFIWMISFVLCFVMIAPLQGQAMNLSPTVKSALGTSGVGVSVREFDTGKIVYEYYGNTKRKIASNMKVVTGAAVLDILGEDYRYETVIYITGPISNGTLNGHVYIKGSGDPTLNYNHLLAFGSALKAAGVQRINGNLYGDESMFTGSQLAPGVQRSFEEEYYAARTTALNLTPNSDFDIGSVNVRVTGSKRGARAYVNLRPSAMGMSVVNNTRTGAPGSGTSISVTRKYGTSQIIVSGSIAPGRTTEKLVTVNNPTINTMYALKDAIQVRGIQFVKQPAIGRGIVPQHAQRIGAAKSPTLKEMLPLFLKLSNNPMGDVFIKKLGYVQKGKGDIATGVEALHEYVTSLGINRSLYQFRDGSGLSPHSRMAPNGMTELLYQARTMPNFPVFYQSLPVGGAKGRLVGGTLKNRFTSSAVQYRVVAKTGTISGSNALSGYAKARSGKQYIFSIIVEHGGGSRVGGIDTVVNNIIQYY